MKTNNYPSWLVSVEQAKKLKEIGFDLPCAFVLTNKVRNISGDVLERMIKLIKDEK